MDVAVSVPEKKSPREGGRVLLVASFVVYLALLAWIILWKLEVPYLDGGMRREIKLVPFAPSAGAGASNPLEVLVNFVYFVPFGLYLGLIAPSRQWWKGAGVFAGASLVFEVSQYILAIGSSDVTDLIVNTAGGLAGFALLALARRGLRTKATTVMTRVCAIGTGFALLASGIFVASPIRFAPPRDNGGVSTHSLPGRDAGTPVRVHAPAA